MVIHPKSGSIQTKQKFGDCQLHVEWMVPVLPPDRKGQDRGNSGVYLQGLYELQIIDSYDNPTYVNGEAGAIYKEYKQQKKTQKQTHNKQTKNNNKNTPRFYKD